MEDFSKYKIKEYKYWDIFIAQNQSYLGRCVIWCKREDALDLTDATDEETKELFSILSKLKNALSIVFQSDWFNYSFLGNSVRHLHCHFIPRYANLKILDGVKFEDKLYGKNWKSDVNFVISEELLIKIKSLLSNALK